MSQNPYRQSANAGDADQHKAHGLSEPRAAYNLVTDTVTGVNVRGSDNKFQAIFVFISTGIAAAMGAILAALNTQWELPWYAGALAGAFAGLVLGILSSGIFLMIYRALRHLKGHHD